ncbi:MAG: SpoIID/LytB domain-containing protein [Bacteroidales bacterium]|nr:SpoIID/LytB domain-containing protein [Bacteroidales bacterium]
MIPRANKSLFVLVFLSFIIASPIGGQTLKVGLYNDLNTQAIVFSVAKGNYLLTADGKAILTLRPLENIFIQLANDSLQCYSAKMLLGRYKNIELRSMTDSGFFGLRILPYNKFAFYDDNLLLSYNLGKLQTINAVDIDKYIAGVVEAEGGYKAHPEYYKTQAILCRTYAIGHLDRHIEENFHLCDGTHCQAYKGRSKTKYIVKAARDTHNEVVVDDDSILIIAAFHSNCGGMTENAENVWLIKKNYLQPVRDPYCLQGRNARWEFKLTTEKWSNYLINNGFKIDKNQTPSSFNSLQLSRRQFYKIGNDSLSFQKIRSDFKLKSAFFSIEAKEGFLIFQGRGYGHGVGLCQEGAMQMATLNYSYKEILQFYYPKIAIIDVQKLNFQKNPQINLIKENPLTNPQTKR